VDVRSTIESLGVYLFAGAFCFLAMASVSAHFRTMTKVELAREIARRTPTHIVEIEWTRRGTAYWNMLKRYGAKAALERELEQQAPGATNGSVL